MNKRKNNVEIITNRTKPKNLSKKSHIKLSLAVVLLALAVSLGAYYLNHQRVIAQGAARTASSSTKPAVKSTTVSSTNLAASKVSVACKDNTAPQYVLVSISQRHMWACQGTDQVLSSAVITGNENIPSDLTPTGTYHIISKLTSQHLIGCDTDDPSDCWNDFVNYDMIFLYNQYGHYDFHDATWRTAPDFGNISPDSSNASHGCVEMPLAAAAWLYNWVSVGTKITIVS